MLNKERIEYWLSVGAQPSPTVHNILVSQGLIKEKKKKVSQLTKKRSEKIKAQKAAEEEEKKAAQAKADEEKKVAEVKIEEKSQDSTPETKAIE